MFLHIDIFCINMFCVHLIKFYLKNANFLYSFKILIYYTFIKNYGLLTYIAFYLGVYRFGEYEALEDSPINDITRSKNISVGTGKPFSSIEMQDTYFPSIVSRYQTSEENKPQMFSVFLYIYTEYLSLHRKHPYIITVCMTEKHS